MSSAGSRVSSSQDNPSRQASGGNGRADRNSQRERKPDVCYGCGEIRHIRPKCPNKVRRVNPREEVEEMLVDGSLAGLVANGLRIDTGAERTVVRQDYVPESAYTGKHIQLDSWRGGQTSRHKLAKITVKVGSAEVARDVAVVDQLDCPALLGIDLGKKFMISLWQTYLLQTTPDAVVSDEAEQLAPVLARQSRPISVELAPEVADNGSTQPKEVVGGKQAVADLTSESVRGTRAQTVREQVERDEDDTLSARSEC